MTPATDPRYPDLETQQIAEKLEAEGHKLPFEKKDPQANKPPVADDDELSDDEKAAKEAEEKSKADEAKVEADKKVKEEADAKAKADLEAGQQNGKKPEEKPIGDPKETLIVAQKRQIKELEKRIETETAELKQQIEKLTTQINSGSGKAPDTKAKIDNSAEKLEQLVNTIVEQAEGAIEPGVVKSILEAAKQLVASGNQLSPELTEKLEKFDKREAELTAQKEEQDTIATETQHFNDEFKHEIADNEDVKKIVADSGLTMDEVKAKIQSFVYSEAGVRYAGVPLGELFTLKRSLFVPEKKKSAEHSRGGSTSGETQDDRLKTAAEIAAMTIPEFEKYSNEMASKSKSTITRRGKPIN